MRPKFQNIPLNARLFKGFRASRRGINRATSTEEMEVSILKGSIPRLAESLVHLVLLKITLYTLSSRLPGLMPFRPLALERRGRVAVSSWRSVIVSLEQILQFLAVGTFGPRSPHPAKTTWIQHLISTL
jgi:hypothetical protein